MDGCVLGWEYPQWGVVREAVSNWAKVLSGGVWELLQGGTDRRV